MSYSKRMIEASLLDKGLPLCVDLDGTLILGNSFWTLWKKRQKQKLLGKSWPMIKSLLAAQSGFSPKHLCYNLHLVSLLRSLSEKGLPLLLVTGANEKIAHKVAKALGCFQDAVGSTSTVNLVGIHKALYLRKRFGSQQYTYIGDSFRDLPVWESSQDIVAISGNLPLSLYLPLWKKRSQSLFFFPSAKDNHRVYR